jgi:hypothetical protein
VFVIFYSVNRHCHVQSSSHGPTSEVDNEPNMHEIDDQIGKQTQANIIVPLKNNKSCDRIDRIDHTECCFSTVFSCWLVDVAIVSRD